MGIVLTLRITKARLILDPTIAAPKLIACIATIRWQPAATVSPCPVAAPQDTAPKPTLATIRAVLRTLPQAETAATAPLTTQFPDLPKKNAPKRHFSPLFARALSYLINWRGLILALPVGLTQATALHLNGGDPAKWD